MALAAHLKELNSKHARLDDKIETELKHPAPDSTRLTELKKKKYQIKQKLSDLS